MRGYVFEHDFREKNICENTINAVETLYFIPPALHAPLTTQHNYYDPLFSENSDKSLFQVTGEWILKAWRN